MRFVLLKGHSQYGSLRLHIDQLAAALAGLDHDVQVIDLLVAEGLSAMAKTTEARPDAYVGFNGVGSDFKAGSASVYDQIGSAYVGLYIDNPVHHAPRLAEPIARYVAFFLDQSHVKLMTAWPPSQKLAHLGFLLPGANKLPEPVDTSDEAFAARDIPLLFTGTYRGQPPRAWTEWEASPARDGRRRR